jgi:thiamine biosynthesis lipoprotein ApbE
MKTDFKYKLEIEVEKEKAKLLMKKLSDVSVASDQTTKLAEMKIKMNQLEKAKSKLESALTNSESELKRINESAGKKANSWFF